MKPQKRGPRGPYCKPPVRVPPPDLLGRDPRDVRFMRQETAVVITGRSPAVVSRWANGRAKIDRQSLTLLQLHAWGAVLPDGWRRRGLMVDGDHLVTENGSRISVGELQAFTWLRQYHREALDALQAQKIAQETPCAALAEVVPLQALRDARKARQRAAETKNPA